MKKEEDPTRRGTMGNATPSRTAGAERGGSEADQAAWLQRQINDPAISRIDVVYSKTGPVHVVARHRPVRMWVDGKLQDVITYFAPGETSWT